MHLERILRDTLYELRQLVRNRLFTVVALASLAVGIGANTAIFSVLNAALLKSLPVPDPQELVMLTDPNASGVSSGVDTGERPLLSYAEFVQLRNQVTTFSGMCASEAELNRWRVRIGGMPTEEARAHVSTSKFFLIPSFPLEPRQCWRKT